MSTEDSNQTSEATAAVYVMSYRTIAFKLLTVTIPIIVLLGTLGNGFSFAVLVRKGMRSTPMYFYLTILTVVDTVVLYCNAFKAWIRLLTKFEVLHVSNVGCKLITFVFLTSCYLSAWLIVMVTVDRFIAVWFPIRGYLWLRIRRARMVTGWLTAVVAVYNAHVFWTFSLHLSDDTLHCDYRDDNFFMNHVFETLKLFSYCVIPFAIVLTLHTHTLRLFRPFPMSFAFHTVAI
jgi:hypothetical protein